MHKDFLDIYIMALAALHNDSQLHTPVLEHSFKTPIYINLNKKYEKFKQMFMIIGKLKEGDKLARDANHIYYIHDQSMYFIQLRRWWESQGRKFTFNHLDEDFSEFMKYLDEILDTLEKFYDSKTKTISLLTRVLVNLIITGLYNLKKTYPQEAKLLCKIDSIILSLIDFKDSLNKILEKSTYMKTILPRQRALSD